MLKSVLALEDGSLFEGYSVGASGLVVGEVVFNTSMTGYQEILSDPSYASQLVTLTYPHIGNVGMNDQDDESSDPWVKGLIVRDVPSVYSSWRAQESLGAYLKRRGIIGIGGIDTRQLTRIIRDKGALNGVIFTAGHGCADEALAMARSFPGLKSKDLAKVVSTKEPYDWAEPVWSQLIQPKKSAPESCGNKYNVVVYDFGVKRNILRLLVSHGCSVQVVPAQTSAEEVLSLSPDGVFMSNGPGDPEPCSYAIQAAKELINEGIPMFGICLGHQILSLASGAETFKMKMGHHGANHPVQDLSTGQVLITSQNHGFAVCEDGLPDCLKITHRSLFDQTIQGLARTDKPVFGFQGHPEASPGPQDGAGMFDVFKRMLERRCSVFEL